MRLDLTPAEVLAIREAMQIQARPFNETERVLFVKLTDAAAAYGLIDAPDQYAGCKHPMSRWALASEAPAVHMCARCGADISDKYAA